MVPYEGDTVHISFVVLRYESSWNSPTDGVDLIVSFPDTASQNQFFK